MTKPVQHHRVSYPVNCPRCGSVTLFVCGDGCPTSRYRDNYCNPHESLTINDP